MALPPVFIEFVGSYKGLKATVSGVKKELATVEGEGGQYMSKLSAVSKAALLGIGIAAVGVAGKSVMMASQFQASMLRISTNAGLPRSQIKGLSDDVLNLAGQVGFSPDSLSEALYHIESSFASTGITGQKAMELLKVAAEGAQVGGADLTDVTNALNAAVSSGIPGVENFSQAMGALNAIVGSGDMHMQDLADALGTGVLAVVKGYGLSLKDVGAALATFGDNNIRGAAAATDLRMAVQAMAVPAKAGAEALNKIGLTAKSLGADMEKGGLKLALNDLVNHMRKAGVTAKEQGDLITTIFGKKAGGGLAVLAGQIDRVNSKYPELSKGANGFGAAVNANNATFQQKMKDAQAAMDALGVKIGTALLPVATKILGGMSKVVSFLTAHSGALIAFSVALGAVGIGFAAASIASWSFTDSLLADPITWIVAGIVLLIAGIVELIMHWKSIAAWLDSAWHDTVHALGTAWRWLVNETSAAWQDIQSGLKTAWHAVASFFSTGWHTVVDPIVNGWHWLANTSAAIWNGISGFFRKWWPLLLVIFAPFIAVIVATWNHFHQQIIGTAEAIWNRIRTFLSVAWAMISSDAKAVWGDIETFFRLLGRSISQQFHFIWDPLSNWLSGIWNRTKTLARSAWGLIETYIVNPVRSAARTLVTWMSNIYNTVTGKLMTAVNRARALLSHWYDIGKAMVMGMVNGIEGAAGYLYNKLENVANNALNAAKNFLGIHSPSRLFASEVGQWISHGIAQGVTDNAHVATNAVRSVSAAMVGAVGGNLGTGLRPSLGTAGLSGGRVVQNVVQVEVKGSVRSDRDLRDVIQQEMLRLGGRNATTWAPYRL